MKLKQLATAALTVLLVSACSSTPEPVADKSTPPVENYDGVRTVTAGGATGASLPAVLTDPKSILSKRSVYFDYDRFEIKSEFKDLVSAHAKFLTENRKFRILIQGNTDERGSREYNIALGQKRADAVKKALVLLGVNEDQVESVSLGEEKPTCTEQNESCWGQNRRADILYSGEF